VQIHRIVGGIRIPVGPDACLCYLKPVGLDEAAEFGVVVAGVEILEAWILVITFARRRGRVLRYSKTRERDKTFALVRVRR
jgi:hypothetical protein